jgi:endonuclease III
MASTNRAALITKVIKVVKKHYKPVEVPKDRNVLEHVVFAACVENSSYEDAEKVFAALKSDYFDWNEVRVSSIRELTDVMKSLNDAEDAATRVKRVLQSVFETHYSFDLDSMKKQNLGQAVKQIEKFHGSTPFSVAFITQHGLGGHSIPVNRGLLEAMRVVGVVSDAEAAKGTVPGLERAVPKTKGSELGGLLHQLGVELFRSPMGPTIRKILLEIDPSCKDRLPKRALKKADEPVKEAPPAPEPAAAKKPSTDGKKTDQKKPEPKKAEPKKPETKQLEAKQPEPKQPEVKKKAAPAPLVKKKTDVKAAPKKAVKKPLPAKTAQPVKKSATKKLAKKKPK